MMPYLKKLAPLALAIVAIASSCSESKGTTTEEETRINSMDSTAKVALQTADKLEDQTKKVEASVEKLIAEFNKKN